MCVHYKPKTVNALSTTLESMSMSICCVLMQLMHFYRLIRSNRLNALQGNSGSQFVILFIFCHNVIVYAFVGSFGETITFLTHFLT